MMLDAKASHTSTGQEKLAEGPPLNQSETAVKWFGTSFFLPSAITGLASGIEDAVAAAGAVDSVHHDAVTPSTRRVDSNAVFEDGRQAVEGEEEVLGWVKRFLRTVAQELTGPGAVAKLGRPVGPNERIVYDVIDYDDDCGGNVGGEVNLEQASADDTVPHSDIEARWERAALRRLEEGVEAYRCQQQEISMVRWGPGGLLVPVG